MLGPVDGLAVGVEVGDALGLLVAFVLILEAVGDEVDDALGLLVAFVLN